VNAVVFYILAVLIVVASGAVVGAPRMREAGYALVAASLFIAILAGITGARIVAAMQFLVPAVGVASILWLLLRRRQYRGMARPDRLTPLIAARGSVALAFAALLVTVFALSGTGWHVGAGTASLITVLHYRAPYALVIAVVLVVAGAGIAMMVGRTGADERETDEALAARRRREERIRRRREDREAARRRRAAPSAESRA
jgi:hypothetical protein